MDLAPDRMILTAELHPQRHHHAGNVSAAEDGVTARQRDQRRHWIGLALRQLTHLLGAKALQRCLSSGSTLPVRTG